MEIIAWIAGPWAAGAITLWAVIPSLVVLIGLPAVFSTKGDKRQVLVPTPGPLRVVIELLLYAVAVVAPWVVWPTLLAVFTSLVVFLAFAFGVPRLVWLLRGAH